MTHFFKRFVAAWNATSVNPLPAIIDNGRVPHFGHLTLVLILSFVLVSENFQAS
mgnify:CR=1 FL=1